MIRDIELTPDVRQQLAHLARRYLWWGEPGAPHSAARMAAQIMTLGTYEDIRQLERLLPNAVLIAVMARAEPGWFSPRSWEFWRGRLRADFPPAPPVRHFAEAS